MTSCYLIALFYCIKKSQSNVPILRQKKRLLSEFSLIAVLTSFDVCLLQKFKELKSLHVFCIDCSKFVVSSKFLGLYTPQKPSKIGLIDTFIYPMTSLWGVVTHRLYDFMNPVNLYHRKLVWN